MTVETIDLLRAALNKDAIAFKGAFNELIAPRLSDAVEIKKIEVAQNMYKKAA